MPAQMLDATTDHGVFLLYEVLAWVLVLVWVLFFGFAHRAVGLGACAKLVVQY